MAVSLSVTTDSASMPVAYRLYLPEVWIKDGERRKKTGVPEEVEFQTKPNIALEQIRRARQRGLPQGVVLADAGYGNDTEFRLALTKMEMTYVMGVQSGFVAKFWEESIRGGRRSKLFKRNIGLGSESEQFANEVRLDDRIALTQPPHPALSYHAHRFDTLQRPPRALKRPVALANQTRFLTVR